MAFPQNGLIPMKVNPVLMVPSSAAPISVPASVPRPPVIAVPPTTTAATACSSKPIPALLGTTAKRTAFSKAANPTSAPVNAKTPQQPTKDHEHQQSDYND